MAIVDSEDGAVKINVVVLWALKFTRWLTLGSL